VGHGDLAAALLANMRALYSTLDRVGDLAISPGKRAELMTAAAMPEAPYPGPMATPSGLREVRD
jgi:hypothetical protein